MKARGTSDSYSRLSQVSALLTETATSSFRATIFQIRVRILVGVKRTCFNFSILSPPYSECISMNDLKIESKIFLFKKLNTNNSAERVSLNNFN